MIETRLIQGEEKPSSVIGVFVCFPFHPKRQTTTGIFSQVKHLNGHVIVLGENMSGF